MCMYEYTIQIQIQHTHTYMYSLINKVTTMALYEITFFRI